MTTAALRALIVDDEKDIQRLIATSLRPRGFQCDLASDGLQAVSQIKNVPYDVVITDLRMPNMHGHTLVQRLLDMPSRPAIVVHTGVLEPKLATDLLKRGVDDILYKPVDFAFLAIKVASHVEKRLGEAARVTEPLAPHEPEPGRNRHECTSFQRFNNKLATVERLLPLSNAAIKVYEMTQDGDWHACAIAAAIQRDAALTADVLRLANCPLFGPTCQKVIRLEDAVQRIGHKKLGEIALVSSALSAVTKCALPWLNANLCWQRSMASGIVLEALAECSDFEDVANGVFLNAIMHPLGRVLLGAMFPEQYAEMIAACRSNGSALSEQERCLLPVNDAEALVHCLALWNVPEKLLLPLKFSSYDFSSLRRLPEPLKLKAELVKAAVTLGNLVVGRWHDWDLVETPPVELLERLGITDLRGMLVQARSDLAQIAGFHPSGVPIADPTDTARVRIPYCSLSTPQIDPVQELLPTLGYQLESCGENDLLDARRAIIVNCTNVWPGRFTTLKRSESLLIVTREAHREEFGRLGRTISFPSSVAQLCNAIKALGKADEQRIKDDASVTARSMDHN